MGSNINDEADYSGQFSDKSDLVNRIFGLNDQNPRFGIFVLKTTLSKIIWTRNIIMLVLSNGFIPAL